MILAVMKNGQVIEVTSKLGVQVMASHRNFKCFKTIDQKITSPKSALGLVYRDTEASLTIPKVM